MLAIELPKKDIETLFGLGDAVKIGVDLAGGTITAQGSKKVVIPFKFNEFDKKNSWKQVVGSPMLTRIIKM